MSEVLVIGHKNPDTDAICSAIGYADFKKRTGMTNVVAARCGDTNDRIDFVLQWFGVAAPRFVADVSPRVKDVMATGVVSVAPGASLAEALEVMDERDIRVLPVLRADGSCQGLVSVFKISRFFFPSPNRPFDSRRVLASIRQLANTLKAEIVSAVNPDQEEDLILMIGAMNRESFSQRLPKYPRERLIVVVGDRLEIQELAIREKVRLIVVTGGLPISQAMVDFAAKHGVSLLLSPHDSATTGMLCRAAIAVQNMIDEQFLAFREDDPLDSAERKAAVSEFHAFPVVDSKRRMVGILSKSDFLKRVERQLILVDHNELSQAVQGAGQVEIIEIIDHHRLGSLSTAQPILFRNEPVGSTSTIVADCFFREQVEMTPAIAGLLLAGVVTDTLNLTSPTTTARDSQVLSKLEKISGVNARMFTEKLFASGSVLISKAPAQAITADCKEYVEKERRFSVAQIEELGFTHFSKVKLDLLKALAGHREAKGYDFSALMVTDVAEQMSLLLLCASPQFLGEIDYSLVDSYPDLNAAIYEMPGVVSRKKQLLPFLTHCMENAG